MTYFMCFTNTFTNIASPVMAHEAMEYYLEVPLVSHAAVQPVPAEAVSSQGGPPLLQPTPDEVVSSQGRPHLLQPAPSVSINLTEEVGNINPGASEEHPQESGANCTIQMPSLNSVNSFISGLQRLNGVLEFLRPPSDHSVGPVRIRRRRGSASQRARTGGSQRTDSAR